MIKTTTCIHAACDICGAVPGNYNDGFDHFELGRESDALDAAEGVDWWTDRATHSVLCDKRDEPHLDRAREIHAALKAAADLELDAFLTYWPELDEQGRSEKELHAAWFEALPKLDDETALACTAEVSDHTCTCLTGEPTA